MHLAMEVACGIFSTSFLKFFLWVHLASRIEGRVNEAPWAIFKSLLMYYFYRLHIYIDNMTCSSMELLFGSI
ncbi:uncharacterized protein BKA55DRAFT_300438 [Fusarium redolens]|uniref:Uncharacterized protein n=1 Tax=Fusarium redolens TaxID=48865 RepID=A0A9P9KJN1_FUSRE|nr:uncharacterized protein BKA55DRAFT_300438 [Fusarium redolens]KAH7259541.1 hypothetical protein BKA55DRAFT_300438 [Fusarium redolens]